MLLGLSWGISSEEERRAGQEGGVGGKEECYTGSEKKL